MATLISGGGTTMEAIIKACQSGEVPMEIACVIASDPKADGIEKARRLGIPDKDIIVIDPNDFGGKDKKVNQERFGLRLVAELRRHGATVVTQNGWLPLTPKLVIDAYPKTMFNQHPGPVPEFGGKGMYGRRVHVAVILFRRMTERDPWTEVIGQRVHEEFDQGVVVKSERVPILPSDTVEDLQQRALPVEHRVQIELLKDVTRGKVREVRRKEVLVKPEEAETLLLVKKVAKLLYPHG